MTSLSNHDHEIINEPCVLSWITTRVRNDPAAQDNSFESEMGMPRNPDICLGNQGVPLIEVSSPEVTFIPITSYLLNGTVVGDRGGACISDYQHASLCSLGASPTPITSPVAHDVPAI